MRCRTLIFISVLALTLILAACAKTECRKDVDCTKPHFTATCVENKCAYTPIPGECGNGLCDDDENKCTCSQDCGECAGKAGKYLVQQCNAQKTDCVQDIPETAQKPITQTRELTAAGSKIAATTTFNQPFNLLRDQVELEFKLSVLGQGVSDLTITRLELTGMTPDKRTVPLADKTVHRPLYEGAKAQEYMIIGFPTAERDGELTNLNLKVYVDYVLTSGTTTASKSMVLPHPYQALKFAWALPEKSSGCPASCDDGNPGTEDVCGPETSYFCEHRPVPGVCGNGICDGTKNPCTCAQDCGPCAGGGTYTTKSCVSNACITQVKPGIKTQPQSLFDDRDLSAFHLQNNYKYNAPFNIKTDKFSLEFTLYEKQATVSSAKITDIRLLEGAQEIAYTKADKELSTIGQKETVEFMIPSLPAAEQEKSMILRVWYEYVQNNQTKQADYTKALGKITLLNPDV